MSLSEVYACFRTIQLHTRAENWAGRACTEGGDQGASVLAVPGKKDDIMNASFVSGRSALTHFGVDVCSSPPSSSPCHTCAGVSNIYYRQSYRGCVHMLEV
jgi:hypothetical protein